MDEGRNVFEEGNAFTMEAVQQQLDQLQACQDCQVFPLPPPLPRLHPWGYVACSGPLSWSRHQRCRQLVTMTHND